ncbi:MAG TPA: iron-containing alcohol dehydrogenase [Thermofilaceae archaeon]|nr:iron-containing alcohol dehydrogenase [Thermofilaceae archaeon]
MHGSEHVISFNFVQPGRVVFHRGCVAELGREASKLGSKALLVTGTRFARRSGYLDKLKSSLEECGLSVVVFDRVEPNPSLETVDRGARLAIESRVDLVVGFGGGSPMDAAKGIAVVAKLGGSAADYIYPRIIEEEVLPIVAIPTTTGTGSEVTRYAVLTDTGTRKKVVIVGYPIVPRVALLDPDVADYMPGRLAAGTGFDALSHALEAYMSRRATPISDLFARESVRLIVENLVEAVRGSKEAREAMMYASMLAGVAINHAGTTLVHGLGYYLTTHHDVHHGLANAMLLPYAIEFYARAIGDKLDRLASELGLRGWRGLLEEVVRLEDEVGIPENLSTLGLSEGELGEMVRVAMSYKRNLENGPIVPSPDEVRAIYAKCFKGRSELKTS